LRVLKGESQTGITRIMAMINEAAAGQSCLINIKEMDRCAESIS
jgi:hypothetical protein